jgi:Family of unknown function (DUF6325)
MTLTDDDVYGPIDFVLVEFPGDKLTGEAGQAVVDLVESGIIRLYDLIVVSKDTDGTMSVLEITEDNAGGFSVFAGARSGLLGDDDAREAAAAMQPGTVAALIVFENRWAVPFIRGVRNSGGELIASARIPSDDVMAALDALEPAS